MLRLEDDGSWSCLLSFAILSDTTTESDEQFKVVLSDAFLHIYDDDGLRVPIAFMGGEQTAIGVATITDSSGN